MVDPWWLELLILVRGRCRSGAAPSLGSRGRGRGLGRVVGEVVGLAEGEAGLHAAGHPDCEDVRLTVSAERLLGVDVALGERGAAEVGACSQLEVGTT